MLKLCRKYAVLSARRPLCRVAIGQLSLPPASRYKLMKRQEWTYRIESLQHGSVYLILCCWRHGIWLLRRVVRHRVKQWQYMAQSSLLQSAHVRVALTMALLSQLECRKPRDDARNCPGIRGVRREVRWLPQTGSVPSIPTPTLNASSASTPSLSITTPTPTRASQLAHLNSLHHHDLQRAPLPSPLR